MNELPTLYYEGQPVMLYTPENPRIHEGRGRIKTVTDYGAVVETNAAATGEFRAVPEEIVPLEDDGETRINEAQRSDPSPVADQSTIETPVGLTVPHVGFAKPERGGRRPATGSNGNGRGVLVTNQAAPSSPLSSREIARESGYIGDPCDTCGSLKVRRKGVCLSCEDCGASGGCG